MPIKSHNNANNQLSQHIFSEDYERILVLNDFDTIEAFEIKALVKDQVVDHNLSTFHGEFHDC